MRYYAARYKQMADERIYRIYVTDALKAGFNLDKRYADYLKPPEKRSATEIIQTISGKLAELGGEDNG